MKSPIRLTFVTLVVLLPVAWALWDDCNSTYSTTTVTGCLSTVSTCCRPDPCKQLYQMQGRWSTGRDGTANAAACNTECNRHFRKCLSKCKCLAENTETIRGPWPSRFRCKCKRDLSLLSEKGLRKKCSVACRKARAVCVSNCETGKCPIIARTTVDFKIFAVGKCARICPPSPFAPACEAVTT